VQSLPGPTNEVFQYLNRSEAEAQTLPARRPIPFDLVSTPTAELQRPKRTPIPGLSESSIETPSTAPLGAKLPVVEEPPRADQPEWVTAQQTALRRYNQGRVRYEQKDVVAANHLFGEACKLDPSQAHYHFYLAMTLIILSQARREHAHHEGCHVTCSLGGSLVSNPRMRYEAEQHLLKAAELEPVNPQIPLRLGLLFKEAGLTKKAEHYFNETLLRDGKNKTALFELELLKEAEQQAATEFVAELEE
jgi:tetratricopeptide (TPR) repeat protein